MASSNRICLKIPSIQLHKKALKCMGFSLSDASERAGDLLIGLPPQLFDIDCLDASSDALNRRQGFGLGRHRAE